MFLSLPSFPLAYSLMPNAFRQTCNKKPAKEGPAEGLIPFQEVTLGRRPYGVPHAVVGAQGRVYTPSGLFAQVVGGDNVIDAPDVEIAHVPLGEYFGAGSGDGGQPDNAEKSAGKKERQWQKWSEDIIPALLKPYMSLLRKTSGLRTMEGVRKNQGCVGCIKGRLLEVSCVFFEREFL